jgi:hypothetical protein
VLRAYAARRGIQLADLANGFANNGRGQPRMRLDQAVVRDPWKLACLATTDWSGRPKSCYGSEGRARRVPNERVDRGLRRPLPDKTAGIAIWLDAREPRR